MWPSAAGRRKKHPTPRRQEEHGHGSDHPHVMVRNVLEPFWLPRRVPLRGGGTPGRLTGAELGAVVVGKPFASWRPVVADGPPLRPPFLALCLHWQSFGSFCAKASQATHCTSASIFGAQRATMDASSSGSPSPRPPRWATLCSSTCIDHGSACNGHVCECLPIHRPLPPFSMSAPSPASEPLVLSPARLLAACLQGNLADGLASLERLRSKRDLELAALHAEIFFRSSQRRHDSETIESLVLAAALAGLDLLLSSVKPCSSWIRCFSRHGFVVLHR